MLDIKTALQLSTLEEIEEQIAERRNLQNQMTGQLYPSILENEIILLYEKQWDIKYPPK